MTPLKFGSSISLVAIALFSSGLAYAQATVQEDNALQTIVVTAERRGQDVQQVPVSIDVVTKEAIANAGIVDIQDLSQVAPGLNFTVQSSIAQPTIRGISSEGSTPGDEGNVAIYVDGVYQSSSYSNNFALPDVDSIQVLKGPQGTLYGRNATGGAILITTQQPSFDPKAYFTLSDGGYNHGGNDLNVSGFASGALIGDKVAGSIAVSRQATDGYSHDVLRDQEAGGVTSFYARGKLLYQPTENANITLSVYDQRRNDQNAFALYNAFPLIVPNAGLPLASGPWQVSNDTRGYNQSDVSGASLVANIDTSAGKITSVSSFENVTVHVLIDGDMSPAPLDSYDFRQPSKTYTQELDFASRDFGPFSFVTGVFGYDSSAKYTPLSVLVGDPPVPIVAIYSKSTATSAAGFFQATYKPLDRLSVIGGLRYSLENRVYDGALNTPVLTEIGRRVFHDTTFRGSALYDVTDTTNVYFTFNQGYKSGVFDTSSFSSTPVNPERANSFEVGVKSKPLPQLTFNLAAYVQNISDLQVQTDRATQFAVLANAASASIKGFDFDTTWKPSANLTLNAGVTALPYAKYTSYEGAPVLVPNLIDGGTTGESIDGTGHRLLKTPKWQGNVSENYAWSESWGQLSFYTNAYFVSSYSFDLPNYEKQHSYLSLNSRVSWAPSIDSHYKVSLWGRNLTNRVTILSPLETSGGIGWAWGPSREVGLSLDVKLQ